MKKQNKKDKIEIICLYCMLIGCLSMALLSIVFTILMIINFIFV